MKWATDNERNSFDNILWTDECMIQLENHRTFSYRKAGEPPKSKPKPKHPYKIKVWAGISTKGAINICIINTSVDSLVYQKIIRTHCKPFLEKYMPDGYLQQDNAPCHTSLSTRTHFQQNGIKLFATPPESPDLNPIENLWHELKDYLRMSVKPRNKEELIAGIQSFWLTITPQKCQKYIGHLKKVVPKVLKVGGEATGY